MRKFLIRWWFTPNWEQDRHDELMRRWNGVDHAEFYGLTIRDALESVRAGECTSFDVANAVLGGMTAASEYPMTHTYAWGPRGNLPGAMSRKGQRCRLLARGGMNSAMVQFEDGYLAVVSRNAIRRIR